jgi:hypothetical protein
MRSHSGSDTALMMRLVKESSVNTGNLDLSLVSFVATTGAVIHFLHLSLFNCELCFFAVLLSSALWFAFSSSIRASNQFGIDIYALLKAVETLV